MAVLLKIQLSCDVTQCRLVIADVSEECSAFMSGSSGSKMAALYIPLHLRRLELTYAHIKSLFFYCSIRSMFSTF